MIEKLMKRMPGGGPVQEITTAILNDEPLPTETIEKVLGDNWHKHPEKVRCSMEEDILELQEIINENTDRDVSATILDAQDLREAFEVAPLQDVWRMLMTWYEQEKNEMYGHIREELQDQ